MMVAQTGLTSLGGAECSGPIQPPAHSRRHDDRPERATACRPR